jgi:diacylglycerol kinase
MFSFLSLVKTLLMTALIIFVMQYEIRNQTIESHALNWLRHSETAHYLRNVAKGGVKAAKDMGAEATQEAKELVQKVSAEQNAQR